jgi:hypothetical protein
MVGDGVTGIARESTPSSSPRSVVAVVTCGEPRRRWSDEERARILAEAMAPGAIASHVALFGVSTGQVMVEAILAGQAAGGCNVAGADGGGAGGAGGAFEGIKRAIGLAKFNIADKTGLYFRPKWPILKLTLGIENAVAHGQGSEVRIWLAGRFGAGRASHCC